MQVEDVGTRRPRPTQLACPGARLEIGRGIVEGCRWLIGGARSLLEGGVHRRGTGTGVAAQGCRRSQCWREIHWVERQAGVKIAGIGVGAGIGSGAGDQARIPSHP
jgi:hypothetical protein